ncbi:MAG: GNAT family N-acetyltransferase [Bacteroidia bacterium]|nr:GNAT family N-acetyltransferase [Bacteroidia bacterium]
MNKEFTFQSYQGAEVFDKIEKETLKLNWERLLKIQTKLSVFQGYDFVTTWYKSYSGFFTPLLFLAWDDDNELVGLLPLAIHKEKNYVVCAGDELAEYHGFIAEADYEESFGIHCLKTLKKDFSFGHWRLGWVAPDSNSSWTNKESLTKHGIYCHLEIATDPVWNLENPAKLKKIKKRANVKRCYRQYNERGNFRYERISGTDRMEFLLKEFSRQSDFKKEALFGKRLFETDPHITDFLIALQEFPEMSHFSVLWLDDKPIAFNHGYVDGKELCLAGYTSYDPSESRNSPGKLHLIELAQSGPEEGYTLIDLTPGKDGYKSRFANHMREVKKMTFYFNARAKAFGDLKHGLKENGFRLFAKAGVNDYDVKFWKTELRAYLKRLSKSGLKGLVHLCLNFIQRKHEYRVFQVMKPQGIPEALGLGESYAIKRNDFSDLVNYHEPLYYVSRKTLFQKSLTRFSRGDKLYSLTQNGKLVFLVWVRNGKYELKLPGAKYSHQFPENSHVAYGFCGFGDKVPQETLDAFYQEIIKDCNSLGIAQIYFCFGLEDIASQEFVKNRGLEKRFTHSHWQRFYFMNKSSHVEHAEHVDLIHA